MEHYLVFGAPCSGKGTICKLLEDRFGFNHKSTGDMIRKHQKLGTRIGKAADQAGVGQGNFLPDHITSEMVKQDLITEYPNLKRGFLLDGYPRTVAQAKDIASFMFNRKDMFKGIIYFKANDRILMERMEKRASESNRFDDNSETFKLRLKKHKELTQPVLEYFRNKVDIIEIDASGTIEEQFDRVVNSLNITPYFSAIVATGNNGEIGKDNQLLWDLPKDMQYFKENTLNKAVIMGRKTYESLNRLDLPNRHLFVLTSDPNYHLNIEEKELKGNLDNVSIYNDIDLLIRDSKIWSTKNGQEEVMVCGGSKIYNLFLEKGLINKVYQTVVNGKFEADSHFPLDLKKYKLKLRNTTENESDDKHAYSFSFNEWI